MLWEKGQLELVEASKLCYESQVISGWILVEELTTYSGGNQSQSQQRSQSLSKSSPEPRNYNL